ncbi:unnamed protein product [Mytilus coruscus]|uniref:CCHC-type domain-containing protein n=1 Tax=Mytilus coruscus TaxID=42192 RepID=A0A6J8AM07_MYTCO|nr:unnamed protein product [Mytilus coruscus]
MDSERTLREARRLTSEGQLLFEESVRQFTSKLRFQHRHIDMIMGDLHEQTQMTKTLACTYKQELMKHFKEYEHDEEISRKYDDYLVSQRCDESSRERASHKLNKVKTEQLSEIIQPPDAFREPSNIGLDRKSRCSRGSSHLSRKRAKVEAAKTRAKFVQEEVERMRKQTAIQADMKLLSMKRDIEEAECELRVLNENFDDDCAISEPNKEDIQRRTAEFILKQTDQNDNTPLTQNLNVDAPTFKPAVDCREVKVQNTTNATNNRYGKTRNQLSCARTGTSLLKPLAGKVKSSDSVCPVHGTSHLLNECRGFRMKPISERREFLKKNGICFRCCGPKRHLRRDCKEFLKSSVCQSREHPSGLHTEIESIKKNNPPESHEEENESGEVKTACTQICGQVTGTNIATRGINPAELSNSIWMKGPAFLYNVSLGNLDNGPHQLVDADSDKEIRPDVQVAKTQTVDRNNEHKLGTHRFSTYSEWRTLVRAISLLKQLFRNLAHHSDKPEHLDAYKQPDALKQAQQFIIREVQMENYRDKIDSIRQGTSLHNNSSLSQLSPILDVDDTLRNVHKLRPLNDGKPRNIIERFSQHDDHQNVLRAVPEKLKHKLRYSVQQQYPAKVDERRRALVPKLKEFQKARRNARIVNGELIVHSQSYEPPPRGVPLNNTGTRTTHQTHMNSHYDFPL